MKGDFLRCGATGWCLEIFWTGLRLDSCVDNVK